MRHLSSVEVLTHTWHVETNIQRHTGYSSGQHMCDIMARNLEGHWVCTQQYASLDRQCYVTPGKHLCLNQADYLGA